MNMVNEYFPEIKEKKYENKYGILNLTLVKDVNTLNGYTWRYTYYNPLEKKVKMISSYDLRKLRKSVEEKGLQWRVTDMKLAKKTYELNDTLLEEHRLIKESNRESLTDYHHPSKSGVKYVYENKLNNKIYWTYFDRKHESHTREKLSDLEEVVKLKGYDWIIKDHEVYESIIKTET